MPTLLKPTDLNMISSEAESEKMDEERKLKKIKEQQNLELRDAFMKRDVAPEVFERINKAVSVAAKLGQHQIQVDHIPIQLLQRRRPADQHRGSRVAEHAGRVCEEGVRFL